MNIIQMMQVSYIFIYIYNKIFIFSIKFSDDYFSGVAEESVNKVFDLVEGWGYHEIAETFKSELIDKKSFCALEKEDIRNMAKDVKYG